MTDVIFHVGDAPKTFELDLLKPDETIDDTYERPEFGYDTADSGVFTAADGSSTFTVSGLRITVSPLRESADATASTIEGRADSDDDEAGSVLVSAKLNVTVLAVDVNADHANFREVTA